MVQGRVETREYLKQVNHSPGRKPGRDVLPNRFRLVVGHRGVSANGVRHDVGEGFPDWTRHRSDECIVLSQRHTRSQFGGFSLEKKEPNCGFLGVGLCHLCVFLGVCFFLGGVSQSVGSHSLKCGDVLGVANRFQGRVVELLGLVAGGGNLLVLLIALATVLLSLRLRCPDCGRCRARGRSSGGLGRGGLAALGRHDALLLRPRLVLSRCPLAVSLGDSPALKRANQRRVAGLGGGADVQRTDEPQLGVVKEGSLCGRGVVGAVGDPVSAGLLEVLLLHAHRLKVVLQRLDVRLRCDGLARLGVAVGQEGLQLLIRQHRHCQDLGGGCLGLGRARLLRLLRGVGARRAGRLGRGCHRLLDHLLGCLLGHHPGGDAANRQAGVRDAVVRRSVRHAREELVVVKRNLNNLGGLGHLTGLLRAILAGVRLRLAGRHLALLHCEGEELADGDLEEADVGGRDVLGLKQASGSLLQLERVAGRRGRRRRTGCLRGDVIGDHGRHGLGDCGHCRLMDACTLVS